MVFLHDEKIVKMVIEKKLNVLEFVLILTQKLLYPVPTMFITL